MNGFGLEFAHLSAGIRQNAAAKLRLLTESFCATKSFAGEVLYADSAYDFEWCGECLNK